MEERESEGAAPWPILHFFSPDYNSKTGKGKEQRMRVKALGDQEKKCKKT